MKNSILIVVSVLGFCRLVYALPQDWPCFSMEVEKYKNLEKVSNGFTALYSGERQGYHLDIELSAFFYEGKVSFADCGNSGRIGMIREISTGREERLPFFCEIHSMRELDKAECFVGSGEEYLFSKENDEVYTVHYCQDDPRQMLRLNLSDCDNCHCVAYWYEKNVRKGIGVLDLNCQKENSHLRCFTPTGYEAFRHFEDEKDDLKKCVGLKM